MFCSFKIICFLFNICKECSHIIVDCAVVNFGLFPWVPPYICMVFKASASFLFVGIQGLLPHNPMSCWMTENWSWIYLTIQKDCTEQYTYLKNSLPQKLKELFGAGGLISLLLILTVFLYLLRTGTGHTASENKGTLLVYQNL